jgi:hypothetical protein
MLLFISNTNIFEKVLDISQEPEFINDFYRLI